MNDKLLEELKSTNPELYRAMLEEVEKLREVEIELQRERDILEEQKKNTTVSKSRKLFSQRGFSPLMWERFGNEILENQERALHSFLVSNLQQEGFKALSDEEQSLYTKRLHNYIKTKIKSPDKLKTKQPKGEAVSLFD
jgi:hypothetical protein